MPFCDMRLSVLAMRLRTRVLLTPRKAKPKSIPKKHRQENSSPQKEGRRSADKRIHQEPHRKGMRRASFLLSALRKNRGRGTSWSGRARLSAPHRGIRGFLGLGSAQAALPGTTGCKREDPL